MVRFVVRWRVPVVVLAGLVVLGTVPVFLALDSEFMPPLNEGTVLYMPTAPPGMSVAQAARTLEIMDRELMKIPEVERVFGKAGRAETATDPAPLSMFETTILLKPRSEWRPGLTWDRLIEEMDRRVQVPGMPNLWWMPIQTRTEMLATGIRSPLGIKVFGDDLAQIQEAGVEIERVLSSMEGTRSVYAERISGGLYLDVKVDREEAVRYGLTTGDVLGEFQAAVAGVEATRTVEGRERYPVQVRYAREFRDTPEAVAGVLVSTPGGAQIPLSHVADVEFATGPDMVRSEDGKLVGFVFADVTGRSLPDYVAEGKQRVLEEARLPEGVRIEWAGQFTYYERARDRLTLLIPLTLILVFLLLYLNTRSVTETSIVLLAVPFSLVGAVLLLYLLGYHLSVAVWVGIIALAGLDAETGVVMLLYLRLAHGKARKEGRLQSREDLTEVIVEGSARRIRPKLMTVLTTLIALLPILFSTGTGGGCDASDRRADGGRTGHLVPAGAAGLSGAVRHVEGEETGPGIGDRIGGSRGVPGAGARDGGQYPAA